LDVLFLKLRGFVEDLMGPLFRFEIKRSSWYGKGALVDLTLHTAL